MNRRRMRRRRARRHRHIDDVNERLRVVNRAQREFLAVVSHELRTPLTGILGSVELLRQGDAFAGGQQGLLLDLIETGAAHLVDLIGDVLDLASAEAGRMQVVLQPVSIAQVCSNSVKLIVALARSKQITVDIEIDSALTYVRAEPRRLRQILVNLLSNAVKFTPPTRRIGLRVTGSADATRAVFEVWDNGPGLTSEQVARLQTFQPYTRLMQTQEGAGLGLSIVKQLVELHSGRLSIHSLPAAGSRFRVEIPLAPPDAALEARRAVQAREDVSTESDLSLAEAAIPAGIRVLLVDDVVGNVTITSTYLTYAGFEVMTADSAQRALDILRDTTVDVLVCDVRMPDMDGLALTRFIRSSARHADLPIIALTASGRQQDRRSCLAAGMNEYLLKPLPLSQLAKTIARLGPQVRDGYADAQPARSHTRIDERAREPAGQGDACAALLLHDINDALGAAIGNLDLALNVSTVCESASLRDAFDSCVRVAELLQRLRRLPGVVGSG